MQRTKDETGQFVAGVRQGAEDDGLSGTSDLDQLKGDPHFADGYSKGYTLVSGELHADDA
jgi:hypothetical protein